MSTSKEDVDEASPNQDGMLTDRGTNDGSVRMTITAGGPLHREAILLGGGGREGSHTNAELESSTTGRRKTNISIANHASASTNGTRMASVVSSPRSSSSSEQETISKQQGAAGNDDEGNNEDMVVASTSSRGGTRNPLPVHDQKRMNRIMANRRSARKSRERMKKMHEDLETSVNYLSQRNNELTQENLVLRRQVTVLSGLLQPFLQQQPQLPQQQPPQQQQQQPPSSAAKIGGDHLPLLNNLLTNNLSSTATNSALANQSMMAAAGAAGGNLMGAAPTQQQPQQELGLLGGASTAPYLDSSGANDQGNNNMGILRSLLAASSNIAVAGSQPASQNDGGLMPSTNGNAPTNIMTGIPAEMNGHSNLLANFLAQQQMQQQQQQQQQQQPSYPPRPPL